MAKVQIKSEKLTPFGGIFHVMELFERHLSHIIDGTLGKRSVSIGYDYSEIIRSLMCVYFCGDSCSEKIVKTVAWHSKLYYIRANRCQSIYNDIFALRGWKCVEINGIEYELNSILVEKWKGMACRLIIQRQKRPGGEQDIWEGEYTYRCIMTNDYESTPEEIVEFYNKRGAKERIFDDLNNSFGWNRLPKSFMNENTVFLLITALIRNFYQFLVQAKELRSFGLKPTSRMKDFTFKFITVPAKWIKTARQFVLNIYTEQKAYATVFKSDFG